MRHPLFISAILFVCLFAVQTAHAKDAVTRRDGFLTIWQSVSRATEKVSEKPFSDVKSGETGFTEITFAKARGILDDDDTAFHPNEPLTPVEALLWLFRTRSLEPVDHNVTAVKIVLPDTKDVAALAEKYDLKYHAEGTSITSDELLSLMRALDTKLATEEHEASLYSEKFHGKGTAFGETFDMYALTAAHRAFPYNTLVKVTNTQNGKSVIVRINDRGPYVKGRDMDLSLAAFTTIAERSQGKIRATFERLGDVNLVRQCHDTRYQQRITREVRLRPGIPHSFALGDTLSFSSQEPFVIRDLVYPDGTHTDEQTWITKDEVFTLTPSITGTYQFLMGTKIGRQRWMRMEVVDCGSQG